MLTSCKRVFYINKETSNNTNSLSTYNNLFEEIFAGLWSPASSAYKIRQNFFKR